MRHGHVAPKAVVSEEVPLIGRQNDDGIFDETFLGQGRQHGSDAVVDHLVDRRRAEALARVAVFLAAHVPAQVRVGHHQVRGLVGLVGRPAESDEVLLAEGDLPVELELLLRPQIGRAHV